MPINESHNFAANETSKRYDPTFRGNLIPFASLFWKMIMLPSEFHKERIMVKEVKWTKYLWLSLLSFGAFMLELLSIFAIEVIILHVDIQNYTMQQRSIHCIIMVFMWAFFIGVLLLFSRKHYHFPERGSFLTAYCVLYIV